LKSENQERDDFETSVLNVKKDKRSDLVISEEGNSLLYTLTLTEEDEVN